MDITVKIKQFLIKLQGLPDKQKKIVLWTVVAILAVVMGLFWIRGAMNSLNEIGESVGQIKFPEIQTPKIDIPDIIVATQTADWKTYKNEKYKFEFKYPVDWTYQEFNCNLSGIALCPLLDNGISGCGQTCGADSPDSPIYFYITPNIEPKSFILWDEKYSETYTDILSTFRLIDK